MKEASITQVLLRKSSGGPGGVGVIQAWICTVQQSNFKWVKTKVFQGQMHAIDLPPSPLLSQASSRSPGSALPTGSTDGATGVGCGVNQASLSSLWQKHAWQQCGPLCSRFCHVGLQRPQWTQKILSGKDSETEGLCCQPG